VTDESKRRTGGEGVGDDSARQSRAAQGVIAADKQLPLPLVPEPTLPGGPRPAGKARADAAAVVDDGATVPVPLLDADTLSRDATPPPLPPSPASAAAEVWLEDAVTRPAMGDPLSALVSSSASTRVSARVEPDPIAALREAHEQAQRQARRLLVLSIITAFAVGLALGVLLLRSWLR
jgi:hypothetical protein